MALHGCLASMRTSDLCNEGIVKLQLYCTVRNSLTCDVKHFRPHVADVVERLDESGAVTLALEWWQYQNLTKSEGMSLTFTLCQDNNRLKHN